MQFFGIPLEFILFGSVLLGVMIFHNLNLHLAVGGLLAITAYKLASGSFEGVGGLVSHLSHEASILVNLLGLLLGFAILAKHFEESQLPHKVRRWLPMGVVGCLMVLFFGVFIPSGFLDNIAAAKLGGVISNVVFGGKIHTGFLAAIVAASNAGGAWSVVGDTTTTMMWIAGVSPFEVAEAIVGALVAFAFFGFMAARQQNAHQPIIAVKVTETVKVDWGRLAIVGMILAGAILANVYLDFPAAGVWAAVVLGAFVRSTDWSMLWKRPVNEKTKEKEASPIMGAIFLLSLVTAASMMPVEKLPPASPLSAFVLGIVSAFFDNIPLTKLALDQSGYDWGFLAYAVGFGGSMLWFGSSAGVAIASDFPQAKDAKAWLRHGWHVPVAYVLGFVAMFVVLGWHPGTSTTKVHEPPAVTAPDAP